MRARGFGRVDVLMLTLVVIWGVNFSVAKRAMIELLPLTYDGLRFVLGAMVLLSALRLSGESFRIERAHLPRVLLAGLVGISFYQILYVPGLSLTAATNASLITSASPTMIVVMEALLGRERTGKQAWLGAFMAFAGLAFVLGGRPQGVQFGSATMRGDMMVLGGTVLWSLYAIICQPLFKHYSAMKVATMTVVAGLPLLLVFCTPSLLAQDWSRVSLAGLGGVAYSGVLSNAIGYIIYYTGVQTLGGSRSTTYQNLTPIIAVMAAYLFLGERLQPLQLLGGLVVVLGVILTRWGISHAARPRPPAGHGGRDLALAQMAGEDSHDH